MTGSTIWNSIQLIIFLILFVIIIISIIKGKTILEDKVNLTQIELNKKGLNLTSNGIQVKTNKRQMTREESEDQLQAGIMKSWAATSFNVPWILKGTKLSGSKHDKEGPPKKKST